MNNIATQTTAPTHLPEGLKARAKDLWEDGDYAAFARFMEAGAEEVLASWNIPAGSRVLDIGCGSGQTAVPAARRGMLVTGVDIAENLIAHARGRAYKEGLSMRLDVGDAEDLPYGDGVFDVAISMFGAMFAPRPALVVSELARVLKPGGRVIMANWTASSMPAQMFKRVSKINPPAPGLEPPVLWGDEDTVRQRLAEDFTDIQLSRRIYPQWQYPFDAPQLVELFRTHFGPVKKAFDNCDTDGEQLLHRDLERIYRRYSRFDNDTLTITGGEYLEVIATRR